MSNVVAAGMKSCGFVGRLVYGDANWRLASHGATNACRLIRRQRRPRVCNSLPGFFLTDCQLISYGVRFYGTVDLGGTYQTHGSPFDKNFPTGASYLTGAGGTGATNRTAGFGLGPNAMSQSNVGVSIKEPIAPGGWSFVSQNELAFDPYSLLLANAPQAMQNGIGVAQNQQAQPYELQPVGVAGGDECRRREPASCWHAALRPAELAR